MTPHHDRPSYGFRIRSPCEVTFRRTPSYQGSPYKGSPLYKGSMLEGKREVAPKLILRLPSQPSVGYSLRCLGSLCPSLSLGHIPFHSAHPYLRTAHRRLYLDQVTSSPQPPLSDAISNKLRINSLVNDNIGLTFRTDLSPAPVLLLN